MPGPVRDGLHAPGFDVSEFVPQLFKAPDVDDASLVVSFDQDIAKVVAGITRSRGASLATRNAKDFEGCGIEVINPWG